jgi:hypothetical protein
MKNEVVEILDQAVALARAAGHDVQGWTMQSSVEGYTAWLYREDDEGQWFLFDEVDILPTAMAAARACAARLSTLALAES